MVRMEPHHPWQLLPGCSSITAILDQTPVKNGQNIDLHTLAFGNHTLTVTATDFDGNSTQQSVTFSMIATIQSLKMSVDRLYSEGKITKSEIRNNLMEKLNSAQYNLDEGKIRSALNHLEAFINEVIAQSGK